MEYYATTMAGLERIAAEEIKEYGGKIREIREGKGRVFFEGDENLIVELNFFRSHARKAPFPTCS